MRKDLYVNVRVCAVVVVAAIIASLFLGDFLHASITSDQLFLMLAICTLVVGSLMNLGSSVILCAKKSTRNGAMAVILVLELLSLITLLLSPNTIISLVKRDGRFLSSVATPRNFVLGYILPLICQLVLLVLSFVFQKKDERELEDAKEEAELNKNY